MSYTLTVHSKSKSKAAYGHMRVRDAQTGGHGWAGGSLRLQGVTVDFWGRAPSFTLWPQAARPL